jgi:hypothetical protein
MAIFACWRGVISWKRTRLRLGGRQARGSSTHISDLVPSGDHRFALLVAQVWSGAWEIEARSERRPRCLTRVTTHLPDEVEVKELMESKYHMAFAFTIVDTTRRVKSHCHHHVSEGVLQIDN